MDQLSPAMPDIRNSEVDANDFFISLCVNLFEWRWPDDAVQKFDPGLSHHQLMRSYEIISEKCEAAEVEDDDSADDSGDEEDRASKKTKKMMEKRCPKYGGPWLYIFGTEEFQGFALKPLGLQWKNLPPTPSKALACGGDVLKMYRDRQDFWAKHRDDFFFTEPPRGPRFTWGKIPPKLLKTMVRVYMHV